MRAAAAPAADAAGAASSIFVPEDAELHVAWADYVAWTSDRVYE